METEDLIYGVPPKKYYYNYWDGAQNCMVFTEDYDECISHYERNKKDYDECISYYERNKIGGNVGVHLGFLKQDPPIQVDPNM
jgi:hypothetical protein